jgi:hypothetical protein
MIGRWMFPGSAAAYSPCVLTLSKSLALLTSMPLSASGH